MVFYTDRFVKTGFAGTTYGPFIFIRPKYKSDVGLLAHEQTHVRQFWRMFPILGIRYRLSKKWRFAIEAEAYAVQSRYYADDRVPLFAKMISEKYGLGVSIEVAEREIRRLCVQ